MEKPNLIENYQPCSGSYSWKKDLRLNAWLFVATAFYCFILWLVHNHAGWSPLTRGLLSLTPLLPAMLYVRSWIQVIRGMDELQRRIQLEAFLFAAIGTVILGVALSTLDEQGVRPFGALQAHGLGMGGAFIAMLTFWLFGIGLATRRYR